MKLRETHLKILSSLRNNGRAGFSDMAREHGLPVTTVYDNYMQLLARGVMTKHTSLLDFKRLGLHYRSFVFVKSRRRDDLLAFLDSHPAVNSIMRINDYDFLVDGIFPAMKEFYSFLESLEAFDVSSLEHHDVIEPVKCEEFELSQTRQ